MRGVVVYRGKSTIFGVVESTTPVSWIPASLPFMRCQI
jgi:hypothetical protein